MSFTENVLLAATPTGDATSHTPGSSISPTGGALILAFVVLDRNAADCPVATMSGGGMDQWDLIQDSPFDGSSTARLHVFRAMQDVPGTGQFTIDAGGVTIQQWYYKIVEINENTLGMAQGANGANAVVQNKEATFGTSATPTLTFDDITNPANYLIATCIRTAAATAITGPTGWTTVGSDLSNATSPTGNMRTARFIGADDTTDWTISGSPTTHAIIQLELTMAGGGGGGDVGILAADALFLPRMQQERRVMLWG